MKSLTLLVFLFVYAVSEVIDDIWDLPLDKNGNLASNWYLATNCREIGSLNFRKKATMSSELAYALTNSVDYCIAVCLEQGTPKALLNHVLREKIYIVGEEREEDDLQEWVTKKCQRVEIGWFSYNKNLAIVNWISPEFDREKMGELQKGKNEVWLDAYLGHKFEVVDSVTYKVLGSYTVQYDAFYPIGKFDSLAGKKFDNEVRAVSKSLQIEYERSRKIQRTFSSLGFEKNILPSDLLATMQAYYYNNRLSYIREDFSNKSMTVNWYKVDTKYIRMPQKRRSYWQSRLEKLIQKWVGSQFKLESTDINGLRRYEDGARLLLHVDREASNAVSIVINVAQEGLHAPWVFDIYDHADRLHHVELSPGEMLFYESARCLHGRMVPLEGGYYVNMFAHFRPIGDEEWYTKSNPKGAPKPVTVNDAKKFPTLSPWNHTVRSGKDLVGFWRSEVSDEL